jgi:soluble lytic murein transglycosylase-like protein
MLKFLIFLFPALVFANSPSEIKSLCHDINKEEYKKSLEEESHYVPLDCNLVTAIAFVESSYNPRAYNPEGSYGVMQVQCSTARYIGLSSACENLFKLKTGLKFGMRYIQYLKNKYTTKEDIIASYNAGRPIICRNFNAGHCNAGEYYNQTYVNKVIDTYLKLSILVYQE